MKYALHTLALAAALLSGSTVALGALPVIPPTPESGPCVSDDEEGSISVCTDGVNLNGYRLTLISLSPSGMHSVAFHARLELSEGCQFHTFYRLRITGESGVIALLDPTWYPAEEELDDAQLAEAVKRSRHTFFIPAREGGYLLPDEP